MDNTINQDLFIYNTFTRKKEKFETINHPYVGMYVCGPTVYGESHLGHARPAITFDIIFRYLKFIGYNVRYVRNITDVGHLVGDADEGEDKILKKARLEQIEPMELVQIYTNSFKEKMKQLNTLSPSIEPHASGHIIEQLELIDKILKNGFAYEVNGSVYFDVNKYNKKNNYGELSGRKVEDLISNTRQLEGQSEKKSPLDFSLWKKAKPEHIMRWSSKWSDGFPGWHLECSAMSTKYLGDRFDIHGGGMDLLFPHHECEIAQSKAANDSDAVKYWMHNNLITINGQKMGKSLGNFITLDELFTGSHKLLEKAYTPMVIRFFILQSHYRKPLDFSNDALIAAEKGLNRLMKAVNNLEKIEANNTSSIDIKTLEKKLYKALNDDFNTPILIGNLFDGVKIINSLVEKKEKISIEDLNKLKSIYNDFVFEICGLEKISDNSKNNDTVLNSVVNLVLDMRQNAKKQKDYQTADNIRTELSNIGIEIKDTKNGAEWDYK